MPIVSTLIRHRFSVRARRFSAEPAVSQSGPSSEWPPVPWRFAPLQRFLGCCQSTGQSFLQREHGMILLTVRSRPRFSLPDSIRASPFWHARIRPDFLPQAAQHNNRTRDEGAVQAGPTATSLQQPNYVIRAPHRARHQCRDRRHQGCIGVMLGHQNRQARRRSTKY
jgi:hypothetical protein